MANAGTPQGNELTRLVSEELRKTFETVATLAMQGSAEAGDPSLNVLEKMRKAHSRITLIIDDAMRGLAEAHEHLFVSGIIMAVSSDEE